MSSQPPPIGVLSLVIPCYNEAPTLERVIQRALLLKGSLCKELEILVVDDASTDGSAAIVSQIKTFRPEVKYFHHSTNLGVGPSMLEGYQKATGDWVVPLPADDQFDPLTLQMALPHLGDFDIICFCRKDRRDVGFYRKLLSHVNRWCNRILFGLKISDVNWVKLYRVWTLKDIPVISKSPFVESERLIRAQRRGVKIKELPAPHSPRLRGKEKGGLASVVLRSFGDMLRVRWGL